MALPEIVDTLHEGQRRLPIFNIRHVHLIRIENNQFPGELAQRLHRILLGHVPNRPVVQSVIPLPQVFQIMSHESLEFLGLQQIRTRLRISQIKIQNYHVIGQINFLFHFLSYR